MDVTLIVGFLTGGSLVASLLVSLLKSALSGISARWGSLATQGVLLVTSLIVAFGLFAVGFLPQYYLEVTGAIFAGAIAIYEVLYKAIYQQAIKGQQPANNTATSDNTAS